jgi:large repetitive protein
MKRAIVFLAAIVLPMLTGVFAVHAEFRFVDSCQGVSTGKLVGTNIGFHQASGDLLLCGYYSGKSIFGGKAMDSGGGANQAFLMRLERTGAVKWVREIRGNGRQLAHGVAVDSAGNSYVTGESTGSAEIQKGNDGTVSLPGAGTTFMFVAKYDPNGSLVWVKTASASGEFGEVAGEGVAVGASGEVYVTGWFLGVGGASFDTIGLTGGTGLFNGFLAKYNSSGVIQWAKAITSGQGEGAISRCVTTDGSGPITIAGEFSGKVYFGDVVRTSSGDTDAFVARYNSAGTLQWAHRSGGAAADAAYGIAADLSGGVVVVGEEGGNGFAASYDSSGNVSWKSGFGGAGDDAARGVSVSSSGRIAVTGEISGTFTIGEDEFTGRGGTDMFVGLYSPSGDFVYGFTGGGAGNDSGRTAVWHGDLLVVAGGFEEAAVFGNSNLGTHAVLAGGELFISILGNVFPGDFTGSGKVGIEDVIAILQMLTFQR